MTFFRWRVWIALLIFPVFVACNAGAPAVLQETAPPVTVPPAEPTVPLVIEPTVVAETGPLARTTVPEEATVEQETQAGATRDKVSPAGNFLRLIFTEPDNIDPQQASFSNEIGYIMLNYLPLMTFNSDLELIPGAAESYEISDDGTTFTFTLRPDQKYSDGEPLTAANFEYGWRRLCDPAVGGDYSSIAFSIIGCEEYYTAFVDGALNPGDETALQALRDGVGVKALDESTLEIRLKRSAPYFLNVAALWVGAPVRQDLVESGGETWWVEPTSYIGNGPFQLEEWEHQSRVRFIRNENYVLPKPSFEAIEGVMGADSNVIFEAYRSGELDISGVGADDLETVENDPELKAQRVDVPGSCTYYLGFNNSIPPFNNKAVRQAFASAIDRESWVRDVLRGRGVPALSFIPPGLPGHDPTEQRFSFDPVAAKRLLESSDFDLGQEVKLAYAATTANRAENEYLAGMLQQVLGVSIVLDPVDPVTYSALFKKGETTPPLFTLGWCADYLDPQDWLSLVFQTGGITADRIQWSNPRFDELTSQADAMALDDPERMLLYLESQRLLVEEAPVAFLSYDVSSYLVQPWIKGLRPTALDYFPGIFGFASIEIITEE